jgi:hypothetical protein
MGWKGEDPLGMGGTVHEPPSTPPELFVSHVDAALTSRARLARQVVEQGWWIARAAERSMCPGRPRGVGYRRLGPVGSRCESDSLRHLDRACSDPAVPSMRQVGDRSAHRSGGSPPRFTRAEHSALWQRVDGGTLMWLKPPFGAAPDPGSGARIPGALRGPDRPARSSSYPPLGAHATRGGD